MKKFVLFLLAAITIYACGNSSSDGFKPQPATNTTTPPASTDVKGVGEIKNVELKTPLDATMVKKGNDIYTLKCAACHKLDDSKLVGPGWKGVTSRRQPEWIMNMILNVDVMLEKDAEAQKLLEQCLTRMPNQNMTEKDALSVLEFMRKNDGVK